jgi:hypothetical protein
MKLFECQNCGQLLYFENTQCERCGMALGFLPNAAIITALEIGPDGHLAPFVDRHRTVDYCSNREHNACNWLVDIGADPLCRACKLNHTIPKLSVAENLERWLRIEVAKHRLVYSLMRLGLPIESKIEEPDRGVAFKFLAPVPRSKKQAQIITGHCRGDITLNIIEADDAKRAAIRAKMNEPYRTLLGHLRHEVAHYYFERVIKDTDNYQLFLSVFGDETPDYGEALKKHYADGAPANWRNSYISSYASAHPHEDWAETFAHYLHMIDTLETAYAFGLRVRPRTGRDDNLAVAISFDPYNQVEFAPIIDGWLPLTFAVNSMNRSMGIDDLYPFLVAPAVIEKLKSVHQIVRSSGRR